MIAKKNETKGADLSGRRKSVAALACVLALAMVACAIVVSVPGEDNNVSGAEQEIPALPSGVKPFKEGMTLVTGATEVYYVLEAGSHSVRLAGVVASDTGNNVPGIILMPGASVIIYVTNAASDAVNIYAAASVDTFNNNALTVTGNSKEVTVTVTCTEYGQLAVSTDGIVDAAPSQGSYSGSGEVFFTIASGASVSVAENTTLYTISNAGLALGFAYSYSDEIGSTPTEVEAYCGTPAEAIVLNTTDQSYTVNKGASVDFIAEYTEGDVKKTVGFTVTPGSESTAGITVAYDGGVGATFSDNTADDSIVITSGQYKSSGSSGVPGMTSNYYVTVTEGPASLTYYTDMPSEPVVVDSNTTVTLMDVGSMEITDGTNTLTFTGFMSVEGAVVSSETSALDVNISGDKFVGSISVEGSMTSNKEIEDVEYVWMSYGTDSYTYTNAAFVSKNDVSADKSYIIRAAPAGTSIGNSNGSITFTEAFSSETGIEVTDATSGIAVTGTIGSDVTITGTVAAGAYSADNGTNPDDAGKVGLTVAQGATLTLAQGTNADTSATKLTVSGTGGIFNYGAITGGPYGSVQTESYAKVELASGAVFEGATPVLDRLVVTISGESIDFEEIDMEFDYAVYDTAAWTIGMGNPETVDGAYTLADDEKILVRAVDSDLTVKIGDAKVIGLSSEFRSAQGLTIVNSENDSLTGTIGEGVVSILGDLSGSSGSLKIASGATLSVDAGGKYSAAISADAGSQIVIAANSASGSVAGVLTMGASSVNKGVITNSGTLSIQGTNSGTIYNNGKMTVAETLANDADGTIDNNGDVTLTGGINNSGTVFDGAEASYTGNGKIANVDAGRIVVADAKENALAMAGAVDDNSKITAESGSWEYTVLAAGGTLVLNGDIVDQYFDGTIASIMLSADSSISYTAEIPQTEGPEAVIETNKTVTITSGDGTRDNRLLTIYTDKNINALKTTESATAAFKNVDLDITTVVAAIDSVGAVTFGTVANGETAAADGVDGTIATTGTVVSGKADPTGAGKYPAISAVGINFYDSNLVLIGALSAVEQGTGIIDVDYSNLDLRVNGTGGISIATGNMNVDGHSTIIAEGYTIVSGGAYSMEGVVILNGGTITNNTTTTQITVYNAVDYQVQTGAYYRYDGTIGAANIGVRPADNPVPSGYEVYNITAAAIDGGAQNAVLISLAEVDLNGMTVTNNLAVVGAVTGAVTVAQGAVLSVGTYTDADATVEGVLETTGITGEVNGIQVELTGATFTADSVSSEEGLSGTIYLNDKESLAVSKGTVLKDVRVYAFLDGYVYDGDDDFISIVGAVAGAGAELTATVETEEQQQTTEDGETVTVTVPVNAYVTVTGAFDLAAEDAGTPVITGTHVDLDNAELTGTGTVSVAEVCMANAVSVMEDVRIDVTGEGYVLTVMKDATVTGAAKSIVLGASGTITNNGSIAEGMVTTTGGSAITVSDAQGLVNALPYYNTITVGGDIVFDAEVLGIDAVTIEGKTVNANGHTITVNPGFTLEVVGSATVNTTINADAVDVYGTMNITSSNVYAVVTDMTTSESAEEDAGVNVLVAKTMGIDTEAVINNLTVGYGNILTVRAGNTFTMNGDIAIDLYGILQIDGALTIVEGADIEIYSCGKLVVGTEGTLSLAGTLALGGAGSVEGTMTVAETGSLSVPEKDFEVSGTLTVEGSFSGTIENNGTVVFDGAAADGSEIVASVGSSTVVNSVEGTIAVTDDGVADAMVAAKSGDVSVDGNILYITDMTAADGDSITVVVTVASATKDKVTTHTANMDVSGSASVGAIDLWIAGTASVSGTLDIEIADGAGVFDISGVVAEGVEEQTTGILNVGGVLNIDGAVTEWSGTINVTGEISVVGATADDTVIAVTADSVINATYYTISTAATQTEDAYVTGYYTYFDAAVAVIGNADGDKVTVMGTQTADADITVTEGTIVLSAGSELTVNSEIVVGASAKVTNPAKIEVKGTLTFEDYAESYADTNADIVAEVVIVDEPARTFTTLANALLTETDIVLNKDVVLTADTVIPAGTTVSSDSFGITVDAETAKKDVTLTVEGALVLYGQSAGLVLQDAVTTAGAEAELVVAGADGHVYVPGTSNMFLDVAGAHYAREYTVTVGEVESTYDVYVVSTLMHAAADSANVAVANGDANIIVTGEITVDEVEFTAPEDAYLTVAVMKDAIYTGELNTYLRGDVVLNEGVTFVTYGAEYTGSVMMQDDEDVVVAQIDANRAVGLLAGVAPATEEEASYMAIGALGKGAVTVSVGTVAVSGEYNGTVAVSAGAVMLVDEDETATFGADSVLNVEGTLDVDGTAVIVGEAAVSGSANVSGTLTVNGEMAVSGTVAVDETVQGAALEVYGTVTVGGKPAALGTVNGTGTVTGSVEFYTGGYLKAYPGADIDGAYLQYDYVNRVSEAVSTSFNVNGVLYMTVYTVEDGADVIDVIESEQYELEGLNTGLYYGPGSAQNSVLYSIGTWYHTADQIANSKLTADVAVGDYAAVYATAPVLEVEIVISEGTGLDLFIDGMAVDNGRLSLTIGTHTVRFDVKAGYDGTGATISFNSQVIQNNGTFEVTTSSGGLVLSASGAVPAEGGDTPIIVPTPDVNVQTNDEMSLTDYLLIVLVVLIVIMAVIVALRMMRN